MDNMVKTVIPTYRIDNSDGDGSYAALTGIKVSGSFAFDLWYKAAGLNTCLVSQKNGFSVGISGNSVLVRSPSGHAIWINSITQKIPAGVWTDLYLGYDGKKITVFLNGYLFGTADCGEALLSGGDILIGAEFTGFVRTVRFYSKPIAEEEYKNYLLAEKYDATTMPNTVAFMDFTREAIPDLSGNNVRAQPINSCSLVNTVEVYLPANGNFAHFADSSAMNIGGFESGEFSLYTKLYIRPATHERHIIAINGTISDSGSVALFADCDGNSVSFTVLLGGKEYPFSSELETYSWADVIVCAKGKGLTVYINGEEKKASLPAAFKRTLPGNFTVGGCVGGADMTCEHYIHTVAVFDKVISGKDAADFLENHPFVFEDDLTALVDFSAGSADELVNGTQVYIDPDDLLTAENTVDELPEKPYQYRINYSATSSDMKKWEGETTVTGVRTFFSEAFGLGAAASAAGLAALVIFLSKRPGILEKTAELYAGNTITAKGFSQAISSIGKSVSKVCFKGLALAPAGAATMDSMAVTAAASALFAQMQNIFYAALAGVGALAGIAATAAVLVQHARKKKPDDDDKDAKVALSSLTLQTAPDDYSSSAIRCRNNRGVINGSEWTDSEKCKNPAVYIADKLKKAKIKLKFRLRDENAAGSHTVSLSANVCGGTTRIFDQFSWESSGLTVGKEYEAELISGITSSAAREFAFEQIELWWDAKVDGKAVVLPNTKLDIYMIPTVPCPPIFLDGANESALLAVEYLKIATCMLDRGALNSKKAEKAPTDDNNDGYSLSTNDLMGMTRELFTTRAFRYVGLANPQYARFQPLTIDGATVGITVEFNETRFLHDVANYNASGGQTPPITIECEVYASILCYMFRLRGVHCRLAYVANPLPNSALDVVNVYSAGDLEPHQRFAFNYHVVVEVSPQPIVPDLGHCAIYDAALGVGQGGRIEPAAGLPFYGLPTAQVDRAREVNAYRGEVFADGSCAVILSESYIFVPRKTWPYPTLPEEDQ